MLDEVLSYDEFRLLPHMFVLGIAYVLSFPIGWNREQAERSAGLRTFPLVAVASCGFVQAAETVLQGDPQATARVIEGVITGMGFIGGGAILRLEDSVRGTATAASLWVTGAIGTAVGLGAFDVAVVLSVVGFLTLKALTPLKREPRDENAQPRNPPD